MLVKPILQQKEWENAGEVLNVGFTQSWPWGDILLSERKKVERLTVLDSRLRGNDSDGMVAMAQVYYLTLPFGWRYIFCPQGPVFATGISWEMKNTALMELEKYFRKNNCVFARLEPNAEIKVGRRVSDVNPSTTLILSLRADEEKLLAGMEKKTRYCLRVAQKNNLMVKQEKNLEIFWNLLKQTSTHDGFSTHEKIHYEKILNSDLSFQLTAYLNNQPISSAILVGYGDTFTYLFAALDRRFSYTLAAYLIQWEAIKLAKKLEYGRYDFFGIAPSISAEKYEYNHSHPYAGFTKFKLGFGGEVMAAPGTFDLVLDSKKYFSYNLLRNARKVFPAIYGN